MVERLGELRFFANVKKVRTSCCQRGRAERGEGPLEGYDGGHGHRQAEKIGKCAGRARLEPFVFDGGRTRQYECGKGSQSGLRGKKRDLLWRGVYFRRGTRTPKKREAGSKASSGTMRALFWGVAARRGGAEKGGCFSKKGLALPRKEGSATCLIGL